MARYKWRGSMPWKNRRGYCANYAMNGLPVILLKEGEKSPVGKAWQNSQCSFDHKTPEGNVGLKLGPKFGGFVDIDLDCPVAVQLGAVIFHDLPAFGRVHPDLTWKAGHRLCRCDDIPEKEARVHQLAFTSVPEVEALVSTPVGMLEKAVLLEVRAGKSQTMIPPSMVGDDWIEWLPDSAGYQGSECFPDVPVLKWADIKRRAGALGLATFAVMNYPPQGGRDEYCLKLAGALVDAGFKTSVGERLMEIITRAAGDTEDRSGKVIQTREKADAGEPVNGLGGWLDSMGFGMLEKRFRDWLGMKKSSKPAVDLGDAIDITDENLEAIARRVVAECDATLYRRGNDVVYIHEFPEKVTEDGIVWDAGSAVLRVNDWRGIRAMASGKGAFFRFIPKLGPKLCPPTFDNVQAVADHLNRLNLPELEAITKVPTLTRSEPGYDAETKLYHAYNDGDFPPLPEAPSKDDAKSALDRLLHHAREFPFVSDVDRAVYAAYLLTSVVRPEIKDAVPAFGFDAPDPRSGKSKLAKIGGLLATGSEPATRTFFNNKKEDGAGAVAFLATGGSHLFYDNIERGVPFYNDTLNAILQTGEHSARRYGKNDEDMVLPVRCVIVATGNHLVSMKDMVERFLRCQIDAGRDRPAGERVFDFVPEDEVRADRALLVIDALTVIKAWTLSGEARLSSKAMGGFEKWSNLVREAVLWLGLADPVASIGRLREDDESGQDDIVVIEELNKVMGEGEWLTLGLLEERSEDLVRKLRPYCTSGNWRNAGYLLKTLVDRSIGGKTLRRKRDKGQWLYKLDGASPGVRVKCDADELRREIERGEAYQKAS